jgi:catechol 2,3-dioxygenase-like lactoylglutathione lyase family enzyme
MATEKLSRQLRGLQTGHVGLNVTGLERSKKFYQEVFGFKLLRESQEADYKFAFLGDGPMPVLTLFQQSQGHFEKGRPGLHHLSFQVDSITQVKEAEQKLRSMSARFQYQGIVPHAEGATSGGIFFEDPDGIRLEIYVLTGANVQAAPAGNAPT